MSRRKVADRISLGTYDESVARTIAYRLTTKENISATVERLFVGERNDQPTDWWHVYVPGKHGLMSSMWLSGWHAGQIDRLIEVYATDHGVSRDDAARRLGYPELAVQP